MAADEQGLAPEGSTHGCDVLEALVLDGGLELLGRVGCEDDLVGPHVDGDVLARVALEMPFTRYVSMMPAGGDSRAAPRPPVRTRLRTSR